MDSLIDQFDALGLKLKPWDRRDGIFAMNIEGDTFTMQVGEGNEVLVAAKDPAIGQLILMVHELPRTFEVEIPKHSQLRSDLLIGEVNKNTIRVKRTTEAAKRHLLVGRDEMGHPFITRLREPAISVRAAHEALKPVELKGQRVRGKGKNYKKAHRDEKNVVRQGEWFFVEVTAAERLLIDAKIRDNLIETDIPIGPAWDGSMSRTRGKKPKQFQGNPHTASELIVVPASTSRRIFVRGKVRHDEHATLVFPDWMRVVRNNEADARGAGVTWVD